MDLLSFLPVFGVADSLLMLCSKVGLVVCLTSVFIFRRNGLIL